MYKKVPYNPAKDFQPIGQILTYQYALVVPTSSPISNLADLVKRAKARPDEFAYGSAGIGAGGHLAGELLAQTIGTRMTHVPDKGNASALADIIG